MTADDPWKTQLEALGAFIRTQRQLAHLSLRDLSQRTDVSNPYLSQIERGLHEPSVRVLGAIARALNMSAETLLAQAGLIDSVTGQASAHGPASGPSPSGQTSPGTAGRPEADANGMGARSVGVEAAIQADERLSPEQKQALLVVYRSYVESAPT